MRTLKHCRGMGLDSRSDQVSARGLATAGRAFQRCAAFHWVAQERGVDFQLLNEVRKINETQKEVFTTNSVGALTLRGKKLAALAWPSRRYG